MPRRHIRFLIFCATLAVVFAGGLAFLRAEEAFILGFDSAAAVFIASALPLWLSAGRRPDREDDDDGGRVFLPLVALVAVAAVLVAVVRMIALRGSLTGYGASAIAATLVLAWVFANLLLAFHYARIGDQDGRAIDFPGDAPPVFSDYVYFSFVIGMTCQTADVSIVSPRTRRLATIHGIAVFFFNLGVLALTINILSGVL